MVSLLLGAPPGEATESACPTGWVRISQEPDVYICPAPLPPPQADIPAPRAQHFQTSSGAADNVIGRRRVVAYPSRGVPRPRNRGSHGPKGVPRGVPRKNAFVMRPRKVPPPRGPRRPRIRSRRNRLLEKLVANAALQTLAVAKVVVDSSIKI